MKAKTSLYMTLLGVLACGNAISADYAVGIVNLGSGLWYGGTGINVYSITEKRVTLVQDYIFPEDDYTLNPASPLRLSINPQHDFVYVAYTGTDPNGGYEPILVAFTITPKGLVYQWQNQIVTGDITLQGTTLTAGRDYVIENTFPDGVDLWVEIYSKSGQHLVQDLGAGGFDGGGLISGHISHNGKFYYSCRDTPATYPVTPANTVLVYELSDNGYLDTSASQPLATSTDPVFVENVCVPTPPRYGDPGNDPGP